MPYPKTKRTKALGAIRGYVKKGYSANRIQRELKSKNLGMRRKNILTEIRLIKKQEVSASKRQKYIPKKYRKQLVSQPKPKVNYIYRTSYIIQNVPVHSRPFRRNYLGFRLQIFSLDINKLNDSRTFRNMLVKLTSEYLNADILDWENFDVYIGVEHPNKIMATNVAMINDRWVFRVEREGIELYSRSGYI